MTTSTKVRAGRRSIGDGEPVYIIAEIGINHNGSLDLARKLIDGAIFAGADAVKFQKRTPELCVPREQWGIDRDTPWGRITYLEYRRKMEFTYEQYRTIDRYCRARGLDWFASCWDEEAVEFMEQFDTPLYKVASATLTDLALLQKMRDTGRPLMLSTGMSEMWQIQAAVELIGPKNLMIAHATSAYPCPPEELNLRMIPTLKATYPGIPIGYSGHEVGLAPTWAAVALGATFVERHITLDRAMWGSDQAASVEVMGFHNLVRNVRDIENALGDGVKRIYPSELSAMKKLRRVDTTQPNHANS